jgi:acetyl-CoA carboxylase biotin carboxyl carrier protein
MPMDIEKIRELVKLMVDNDLSEVDIHDGEDKISLKRGKGGIVVGGPAMSMMTMPAPAAAGAAAAAPAAPAAPPKENLLEVRSPMVGTFYSAPSPDSEAYVKVGANISDDTVVCIIEAMKVMNEIKAEVSGQVVEVCVKNAQPVEYGQVLFRVRPA